MSTYKLSKLFLNILDADMKNLIFALTSCVILEFYVIWREKWNLSDSRILEIV